jgi:hypothetical protein
MPESLMFQVRLAASIDLVSFKTIRHLSIVQENLTSAQWDLLWEKDLSVTIMFQAGHALPFQSMGREVTEGPRQDHSRRLTLFTRHHRHSRN